MRNVGNGEVLTVEAWDLVSGLQLAKDLGITHLMVESDSSVLINLLLNHDLEVHPLGTLLLNCKSLMNSFLSIFSHPYSQGKEYGC